MLTVNSEDRARIAPLFADMEDTMIRSCLQGRMGEAYADALPPACAQILLGDFAFLGVIPLLKVIGLVLLTTFTNTSLVLFLVSFFRSSNAFATAMKASSIVPPVTSKLSISPRHASSTGRASKVEESGTTRRPPSCLKSNPRFRRMPAAVSKSRHTKDRVSFV